MPDYKYDHTIEEEGNAEDEHGYVEGEDLQTKHTTGYNDWEDLPEPYKSYDFILQEIENENENIRTKLFELVKAPDEYSDMEGNVYDELNKNKFTQEFDGDYFVHWVYLSGRQDDWYPVGYRIGDEDINKDKLDDFKSVEVFEKKKNEVDRI